MRFASTRNRAEQVSLSSALERGLALDGGLYMPTEWPQLKPAADPQDLPALALELLRPFAAGDVLQDELPAIVREAFNFPAPLTGLSPGKQISREGTNVLELFHGPTAAFKDFGARFLAAALARLPGARELQILVATSGDTGGAVAAAFHRRERVEVAVLFPQGLVSPTQERQLTCWDANVRSFAVRGRFDDCQRLVKQAFADAELSERFRLSSANSINLGRLLPQMVYYWAASLTVQRQFGLPTCFAIPSGNLGNATACVWARRLGAPIGTILLAHNANSTVPDYLREGVFTPRPSIATLSSAMDVGDPSNLERLSALFPDAAALGGALLAVSIDDGATRARIREDFVAHGRIWCPHSAVAAEALARVRASGAGGPAGVWSLVATAHPAKFREIIEPLIGSPVPMPATLARLYERPVRCEQIDPTLQALKHSL
ncbi:MAG TPA: threonine synthase [Steroidobacteraceae bacterium]|nr:threonine synthase [Steroidobacteraceae bacterium]